MNTSNFVYSAQPFPHAFIPELIAPKAYAKLKFPDLPERPGGRIGRDLYPGEDGWAELMETSGWKELSSKFMGESFVRSAIDMFAEDILRGGADIDPKKVYYEPYFESRKETESHTLSNTYDPNSVFVRFDLQAIGQSYGKGVHCDWPRRIFGGVLFLADAEKEGIEGGEFGLFSDEDYRNDRQPHKMKFEKAFPLVGNTGILFLNTNNSFHGPRPMRRADGLRKWIYYSISSRRNIWTERSKTSVSVQGIQRGVESALQAAQPPKVATDVSRPELEYIVTGLYRSLLKREPDPVYLRKHCDHIEGIGLEKGIAYLVKHFLDVGELRRAAKTTVATP